MNTHTAPCAHLPPYSQAEAQRQALRAQFESYRHTLARIEALLEGALELAANGNHEAVKALLSLGWDWLHDHARTVPAPADDLAKREGIPGGAQ